MSAKNNTLVRSTLSVTLIIFISKAIGFVREMIMAAYFGADHVTDAYNAAYSLFYLPVLLFSSCITSTLMPEYLRSERELGRRGSDRFGSNAVNMFSLVSLLLSGLMFAFARPLTRLIYPGFDAQTLDLAVLLSRVMYPALIFFVAALALTSILNARERYIAAQLTGFPLSVALIIAAIFFSKRYGIHAQAWGVIAAGVGQVLILIPCLRGGFTYRPVVDVKDERIKKLAILAGPAMLSMAVNELNHMIDRMLASSLNGGDITAMSYAFKLIMFMMGVLVVPLTTVSFTKMSHAQLSENKKTVRKQVRESIKMLLTVILPIVIIAACCSTQVIRLAYGRGRFTEENVLVTGTVFLFYVIGVPFFGIRDLLNRVYHSCSDTKTPMVISVISMALNICANLILRKLMGVNGLALATGIAAFTGVCLLIWRMHSMIPGVFSKGYIKELSRLIVANIPVLLCALLLTRVLPDAFGEINLIIRLVVITIACIGVYAVSVSFIAGANVKSIVKRFIKR